MPRVTAALIAGGLLSLCAPLQAVAQQPVARCDSLRQALALDSTLVPDSAPRPAEVRLASEREAQGMPRRPFVARYWVSADGTVQAETVTLDGERTAEERRAVAQWVSRMRHHPGRARGCAVPGRAVFHMNVARS
jgi:hypothetical protein